MAIIAGEGSYHAVQTGGGICLKCMQDYIFHSSELLALFFFVGKKQRNTDRSNYLVDTRPLTRYLPKKSCEDAETRSAVSSTASPCRTSAFSILRETGGVAMEQ